MTFDAIRRQLARNADQLQQLAEQAEQTGKKVRGQSAEFWRARACVYRDISTADDATVAAHLKASQQSATARLRELRSK